MRKYSALIYHQARPPAWWRRGLWRLSRVLHDRTPKLAARLARVRRILMPKLYMDNVGDLSVSMATATESTKFAVELDSIAREGAVGGVVHYIGSLQAGGAERQALYTLSGLERAKVPTALVVSEGLAGGLGHYLPLLRQTGVSVRWAGDEVDPVFADALKRRPEMRKAFAQLPGYLAPRVADAAAEFFVMRPSIVHCWLDHTNIWGGLAAVIAGVEHIILSTRNLSPVHFPYLHAVWFRDWYRWLLNRPEVHIINNSRAGARDYAEWLGVSEDRFRVILNGVDFDTIKKPAPAEVEAIRRELRMKAGDLLVVGVARLSDEKQPLTFVETARRVCGQMPNVVFALAGVGVMGREVKKAVRRCGLKQRVHLLGRRSDVPAIDSAADAFLLTSRAEGTPNVLLEAQYLGCPPVSTKAGGAVDAVLDGETGFLADVGDVDTLTARLLQLLRDPALRTRFSERGPRFMKERFSLDRMIGETLDFYGEIDPTEAWRKPSGGW